MNGTSNVLLALALALPTIATTEEFCADKKQQGLTAAPANLLGNVDCRGYFNCWNGDEPMIFCAAGTMFDAALKMCQWASLLDWQCGSVVPPPTSTSTMESPPSSTTTSAAAVVSTIELVSSTTITTSLPSLTTVKPVSSAPSFGSFCANKQRQGITAAPASWPGNIDCRGYFNCWAGEEPMLFCPVGTMFDPAIRNCQWSSALDWVCVSSSIIATSTTIGAVASTPSAPTLSASSQSTTFRQSPGNAELVAFVENWLPCPSIEKIRGYTKVVVSFAVSYTWQPRKNLCDTSCTIGSPVSICGNSEQPGLIKQWKEAGTTVLLSFGGAGMGGSWAGDVNDCWEHCFDRVDSVVSQLRQIVFTQDFDGVDIDYEYFLTTKSATFLTELTTKLKKALGSDKIASHAPMDSDLDSGDMYFNVLKRVAPFVDYLLPQYYNGFLRPANDMLPVLNHFGDLVHGIFNGNESKVIFGFCIKDCPGFNIDGNEASRILEDLGKEFPNHGGAFLWAASHDVEREWSSLVRPALGLPPL